MIDFSFLAPEQVVENSMTYHSLWPLLFTILRLVKHFMTPSSFRVTRRSVGNIKTYYSG